MSEYQNVKVSPLQFPQLQYCFAHQQVYRQPEDIMSEKPHIHDSLEIYINISGDASFLVNNHLYPVRKGDAVVTRPGDVHICVCNKAQMHENFCFWISCPPDSPLLAFAAGEKFHNHYRFNEQTRQELLDILYKLRDAEYSGSEPARICNIFRLLTVFAETEKKEIQEKPALPDTMQQVLNQIHSDFLDIHNVNDIADRTHVSVSTLNRWFRNQLQLSPHKYVEALKLAYAQKLLLDGWSVTETCYQSGFSDCSRFIAVFREKFGQTPLQYQKSRNTQYGGGEEK